MALFVHACVTGGAEVVLESLLTESMGPAGYFYPFTLCEGAGGAFMYQNKVTSCGAKAITLSVAKSGGQPPVFKIQCPLVYMAFTLGFMLFSHQC